MVRVVKLEVHTVDGDYLDARRRWLDLARQMQVAVNCLWQQWLVWHVQNQSAVKIRAYLDANVCWKKDKVGERPKCEVVAVPPVLNKLIRRCLGKECPGLHSRVRELLQHATEKKIRQRKASRGSLSGWMAILLCQEGAPSATRPQPIPFDRQNAGLVEPWGGDGDWQLVLRMRRLVRDGRAASLEERLTLRTKRRTCASARKTLERIMVGECKFCGSNLVYDRGKWFVHVAYQLPKPVKAQGDSGKTAILWPAHERPWKMRIDGYNWWVGGRDARHVAHVRQKVLMGRWGRQATYRHAGPSGKGHGRNRALGKLYVLQQAWKNFCRNCNHQLVRQAVDTAVSKGCGQIVYLQPEGGRMEGKLLVSRAGNNGGRGAVTGWPWYQVATQLRNACQDAGLVCIVKKLGARRGNGESRAVFTRGNGAQVPVGEWVASDQVEKVVK